MPFLASFLLLLLTGLLGLIAVGFWQWAVAKRIKGPKHWPVLGATLEAIKTFDRHHDWITGYASKFGTFEMTLFPSQRLIYTTDPANIEHFLKTNFSNYFKGTTQYEVQHELLGEGIFNSDGERWKQQRKTASFEFATKVLRQYSTHSFRKHAIKLATLFVDVVASKQKQVDMNDLFMRLTLDSICEVGFGVEMGALSPSLPMIPFAKAFDSANAITLRRFFYPFWKLERLLNIGKEAKLKKDVVLLDKFTTSLIQKRRHDLSDKSHEQASEEVKSDLLSRFLTMNTERSIEYTNKMLRDVILNFVIAGRDTTSTTLTWFIYLVSQHSHVHMKLLQDINGILQKEEGDHVCHGDTHNQKQIPCKECIESFANKLNYESLAHMHYLHATLYETLRLYPAVPEDGKMAHENDVLPDGTQVKAGNVVIYAPYAMGRMENLWGKDALEFKPDRWLKDGVFEPQSPFKFTAFQAGPRICLGKDFAFLQMKMTAALLLKFFKFHLASDQVVNYSMALSLSISKGLHMYVESV